MTIDNLSATEQQVAMERRGLAMSSTTATLCDTPTGRVVQMNVLLISNKWSVTQISAILL